jgi:hypothetical protein
MSVHETEPPETMAEPTTPIASGVKERRRDRFLREWLPVSLFFTLVGFVSTWPLVSRMTSGFYGFGNDNWGDIWFLKWINYTFWSGTSSHISHELQYPFGYVFDDRYIAPYDRLMAIGFGSVSGGLFAYNLMILLSFPMAGVSMYAFARYMTHNRSAALLGALIFTISPFHLAMAMQYPAMACIFPIPLLALALVHALRTRRLRDAAWAGAALALVWLTSYYYGWFAVWFVLVFIVVAGVIKVLGGLRRRKTLSVLRRGARFVATHGAVFSVTFLAISVPLLFKLIDSVLSNPTKYARDANDLPFLAVHPWMYILPPHDNPIFGPFTRNAIQSHLGILPVYEQSVYLGAVAVAFSLVALVLFRKARAVYRSSAVPLLVGAVFCGLLTLGPSIPLNVFSVSAWMAPSQHKHITGPDQLLFDISQDFRYYGRAFVFVSVVLALLAAVGFAIVSRPLTARFGRRASLSLLVVAMAGVAVEFTNLPPEHFVDLSTPPWLTAVEALPKNAVIMEYPDATYSSPRSLQYIYWQTRHGRTTVNPPNTLESQAFMSALDDPNSFLSGQKLSKAGVDFVVVHTRLASPTYPPYQPAWPSDQLPRSAGKNNPWFKFYRSTSDAVIYRVLREPAKTKGPLIGYGQGWYALEVDPSGHWRWMQADPGQMFVYAPRTFKHAEIDMDMTSFWEPRTVDLKMDGERIAHRELSPTAISRVTVPLTLKKGLHIINIDADPGPITISDVLNNNDRRTVSVRVGQVGIRLLSR